MPNLNKANLKTLRHKLILLENGTDWHVIATEIGMEKQIEIHAEISRTIKRIEKELL